MNLQGIPMVLLFRVLINIEQRLLRTFERESLKTKPPNVHILIIFNDRINYPRIKQRN